ncbi:hypothetical protein X766_33525 [Mesorhizobium sp. LSJC255A00]|nr:hypothetical protein X766_33525 [Mesorhizobium sp. LSJC255A00]
MLLGQIAVRNSLMQRKKPAWFYLVWSRCPWETKSEYSNQAMATILIAVCHIDFGMFTTGEAKS